MSDLTARVPLARPTATPFRTSGKVGRSDFSTARGLSAHHWSASSENLLRVLANASEALHLSRGSHLSMPLRNLTVSLEVSARNLRSRLSARPEERDSRCHLMSSGQPIADSAAISSVEGEPISLTMSASCSIGVSPGKQGTLNSNSARIRPADHISTDNV